MSEEEEVLKMQLAALEREYRKACEPIIKKLAAIHAMKQPKPIFVDYNTWASLQENEVMK
jgi:hypothetical protein